MLPERRELMLKLIQENAAHMLSMVNGLLDVSAIEYGDFTLSKRFNNLAKLAEEKHIHLDADVLPQADIEFELEKIHQVIVSTENEYQVFAVIDQGPGIAEDKRHRLFGAFARLGNQTTGGESSTGLGLAICKAIIQKPTAFPPFHRCSLPI